MAKRTFKRNELKFMIDERQYKRITRVLPEHMELDEYCEKNGFYMIYSLYFDTEDDEIIRKSISKPYYKEKLRIRSYKMPSCDSDTVFLELKKKIGGVVSKRRATISYGQAKLFLEDGTIPQDAAYVDKMVLSEIREFLGRHPAEPKVFISYERVAFHGRDDPEFRVTFDKNILTRREAPSLSAGDYGAELLGDGVYLMEVKISGSMQLWFAHLLSTLGVYSAGFSKYGEEYKNHKKARRTRSKMPSGNLRSLHTA